MPIKRKTGAASIGTRVLRANPNIPVEQFVSEVMDLHTKDGCEFFVGAEQRILANWKSIGSPELEANDGTPAMEKMYDMMDYEESYCPHEGIDKRH